MNKFLISVLLLLGTFINDAQAGNTYCNASNAYGIPQYVMSPSAFTDGRILVQLEDATKTKVCSSYFSLIPSVVGSQRFDLMYSNLVAAVSNHLMTYIEFNSSGNLIGVSVYNSAWLP
jgi:hypothetical protein